jgi:hypothetical protein
MLVYHDMDFIHVAYIIMMHTECKMETTLKAVIWKI